MVKIGMLLPEERMVEPARKIIEENHLDCSGGWSTYSGCQRISGEVN